MIKKKKEPETNVCPKCGGTDWLGTTKGAMCKKCGFTKGQAPFVETKDED